MDVSYHITSRKKLLVLNFKHSLRAGTEISRRWRAATPGVTARTARMSGGNETKILGILGKKLNA
jgi:hypothetical protein